MRRLNLVLVLAAMGSPAAFGQAIGNSPENVVPRFELSGGYLYLHANAPPGGCECFGLNGGYVSGGYRIKDWFDVVGEATGSHANNISALGQNLTLMTFMGGPRVAMHRGRLVPFAQALFGVGRGSDSYFPTATSFSTSASGFAYSAGGGLDINLTHRLALRAIDAEYLKTSLPNDADNSQNHLKIAAGIVVKFGGNFFRPTPPPPPMKQWSEIHFTCGAEVAAVDAGQMLEVIGNAETRPDQLDLTFVWSTNGGRIQGGGRRITVDTSGLAPGEYHVSGRAALVSNPSTTASCETAFHVNRKAEAEAQVAAANGPLVPTAMAVAAFHENVQDALFDYDSYKIRPDGQVAIEHAADYLKAHPEIGVTIGGYSDERGSAEYNLALGEKRASAARDALVEAGVDSERLKIISYGKEAQVCTAGNEKCWQQNRRAAFNMHY